MSYFKIAGYLVSITGCEYPFFHKRMSEYLVSAPNTAADMRLVYRETDRITRPEGESICTAGFKEWIKEPDGFISCVNGNFAEFNGYFSKLRANSDWTSFELEVKSYEDEKLPRPLAAIAHTFIGEAFRFFLMNKGGLVIHSSSIVYQGRSVIFSAPPETGKSTHTGLWKKYFADDVTIINDDSPAITLTPDGEILVNGTP